MKTKASRAAASAVTAISAAVVLLTGALHTVLVMFQYDYATDHFIPSTRLPGIFYAAAVGAVALLGLILFLGTKKGALSDRLPDTGKFTTFASFFSGAMLFAAALYNVVCVIGGRFVSPSILRVVMLIMTVPAAMNFFAISAAHNIDPNEKEYVRRRHELSIYLRCGAIVWTLFCILTRYFSMTQPLSCPLRICAIMAYAALSVYFAMEIKMDIEGQQHPRLYVFFGILAAVLMAVFSLQDAVTAFAGLRYADADTMFSVAGVGISAYICGRIIDFTGYAGEDAEEASESAEAEDGEAEEAEEAGEVEEEENI